MAGQYSREALALWIEGESTSGGSEWNKKARQCAIAIRNQQEEIKRLHQALDEKEGVILNLLRRIEALLFSGGLKLRQIECLEGMVRDFTDLEEAGKVNQGLK